MNLPSQSPQTVVTPTATSPVWMSFVLKAAGVYNVLWGTFVILFPLAPFDWVGMERPNYPELWQCIGMIVGVYGIGYWIAGNDCVRHWPIVLVGLLGKIAGPIGFVQAVATGRFPLSAGWTILTNDLIWWVPFTLILWHAFRSHNQLPAPTDVRSVDEELKHAIADSGDSVWALSQKQPVLLLMLRHGGCTFCIEALDDLSRRQEEIVAKGWLPVVVHMGPPELSKSWKERFSLGLTRFVCDLNKRLYAAFGAGSGTAHQLFGPAVVARALFSGVVFRFGIGRLAGDGFQMPETVLIHQGRVVWQQHHQHAADPVNWQVALACPAV